MTGTLQLPQPTWLVGGGNMGRAILDGWRLGNIDLAPVTVIRPSGGSIKDVRVVTQTSAAGPPPALVILAFKPQKIDEISAQLRPFLSAKTVLVCLLAGVEIDSLRARFKGVAAVVRAMPNLAVSARRGVTGLYSRDADERSRELLNNLFSALGFAMWMSDEEKLAAVGSLAGAGPAYVARFIAALAKAGEKRGLSAEISAVIARETVLGTAWMAATTGEDMESIAKRVASPNGTTEAGLAILDGYDALDLLIASAIQAAARRGADIAKDARTPLLAEFARLS